MSTDEPRDDDQPVDDLAADAEDGPSVPVVSSSRDERTGALRRDDVVPDSKLGLWQRLHHGETHARFIPRWKIWFAVSGVVILVGLVSLGTRGLNLGIDFTGGNVWTVPAGKASASDVEKAMTDIGLKDVRVQATKFSERPPRRVRLAADDLTGSGAAKVAKENAVSSALAKAAGVDVNDVVNDGAVWTVESKTFTPAEAERVGKAQKLTGIETRLVPRTKEQFSVEAETIEGSTKRVEAKQEQVATELAKVTGSDPQDVSPNEVGPSWGREISSKARTALIVFLIVIALYITLRFEAKMAIATIAALIHDILVVVGVYSLAGFPVTPETVIAILTILGFSIYDGIVVFDRVDENARTLTAKSNETYSDMANRSLNQVLMRSLNTSITALLPITSILLIGAVILGATTLEDFGLALFIGVLSGAYSSLFIATPVLVLLKEREPRYKELRARVASRTGSLANAVTGANDLPVATAGAGASTAAASGPASRPTGAAPARTGTYSANHPPRPRKKGKKR